MRKIIKTLIFTFLVFVSANAQNIDFKSSNFKNDKDGFKKAESAIEFADSYFTKGNELVFSIKER